MSNDSKPTDWDENQLGKRLGTYAGDFVVDPVLVNDESAWRAQLKYTRQGELRKTVENVRLILENDPAWKGVLAQNERDLSITITNPPFGDLCERSIRDADINDAQRWFGANYDCETSAAMMAGCLSAAAEHNKYDRVRDYLESVKWDGTERLPQLLSVYFGATQNNYTSAIGMRWMISAVARTLEPGCKADHVLVIEGDQGIGKSTAAEVLCGSRDWFGDAIPNIDNKDAQQYIGGTWIVELAEMDAANRSEASTLKSFISSSVDRYRPPYGRFMVDQDRRCVFVGTVNHDTYLKDDTGGRRFWCFSSSAINLEGLRGDRDQLWAEAVQRYRKGQPWHLVEPELIELAKGEQGERLELDPWHEPIEDWLNKPHNRSLATAGVSTAAVLDGAIKMDASKMHGGHGKRVGGVMRALGWRSERRRIGGKAQRLWYEKI